MARIFLKDEIPSISFLACEAAFAFIELKEKDLKPRELEKQLARIKNGLKLIEALELAEQFVIKEAGASPEEYEAYYLIRNACFKQKLQSNDLGYAEVEKVLDRCFLKALFRITKSKEGIKEKLESILKSPQKISEADSKKCQNFFNSMAASTT